MIINPFSDPPGCKPWTRADGSGRPQPRQCQSCLEQKREVSFICVFPLRLGRAAGLPRSQVRQAAAVALGSLGTVGASHSGTLAALLLLGSECLRMPTYADNANNAKCVVLVLPAFAQGRTQMQESGEPLPSPWAILGRWRQATRRCGNEGLSRAPGPGFVLSPFPFHP